MAQFAGHSVVEEIGEGGFAKVYLCTSDATGDAVAIKQFVSEHGVEVDREKAFNELAVLRQLGEHPHVLRLLDVVDDQRGVPSLVLEYCGGGDLIGLITNGERPRGPSAEAEAFSVWREMVLGVAHMHQRGVAHLDLKPQNVLLHEPSSAADEARGRGRACLCDFSHSWRMSDGVGVGGVGVGGAPVPPSQIGAGKYMGPEVSSGDEYAGAVADVWSLGVILYGGAGRLVWLERWTPGG